MTLKSEEAEHDAAVMDARGVSWDALRLRTESERLAAQRLASEAGASIHTTIHAGILKTLPVSPSMNK